jgi:hypothetical protein
MKICDRFPFVSSYSRIHKTTIMRKCSICAFISLINNLPETVTYLQDFYAQNILFLNVDAVLADLSFDMTVVRLIVSLPTRQRTITSYLYGTVQTGYDHRQSSGGPAASTTGYYNQATSPSRPCRFRRNQFRDELPYIS